MAHYGVVIGCSRYDDARVADLQYAHEDAVRFASTLGFVAGIPEGSLVVLHDGADSPRLLPTRSNVLRTVASLASTAEPIDTLHFFFSGHGYHSWVDGSDYLIMADSIVEAIDQTSLQFDFLVRLLNDSGARHTVLYLDACRAAMTAGKGVEAPLAPAEALSPPGMVSFCSCAPGEVSYEADELGGGIFTAALLDALSESGQCVTVQDVDDHIRATVPALSSRAGKPSQRAHTRVEPLSVQGLELVEPQVRTAWSAKVRLGSELRIPRTPVAPAGPEDPIVAIDFGTSYSAIAFTKPDGAVQLIKSSDQRALMPSVVSFTPDLDYRVGSGAVEMEINHPTATVRHVKRLLGTGQSVPVRNHYVSPEVLASLVVRSLKTAAEEALGHPVYRCLASYPANFDIRQSNALLRAFELAGLSVFRMIGEPNIAAALLHAERPGLPESMVLIVDLGGGTLDVAIAELADGVAEIRSVSGANELGGLDYDEAILGFVRKRLVEQNNGLILSDEVVTELRREAERAKRALTTREHTTIVVRDLETDHGLHDEEIDFTRADLRQTVHHLDLQVAEVIQATMADTEYTAADIDIVLLTGQGAKIIITVAEVLRTIIPQAEVVDSFQELGVVRGLATYTGVLTGGRQDVLLMDLVHHSVGFRAPLTTDGSSFHKTGEPNHTIIVLPKHATIPTRRSETYVFTGEESEVRLHLVEQVGSEYVDIGVVRLHAPGDEVVLDIEVDFDANSSIIFGVYDRTHSIFHPFQLNHHYRDLTVRPDHLHAEIVGPVVKLRHDGDTTDKLRPDTSRRRPGEIDRNDVRLARSDLANDNGKSATAMRHLYEVIVEGPHSDFEAATLARLVCKSLRNALESHRAPVIDALIRSLTTFWRPNPPPKSALNSAVSSIQRLGDFLHSTN